MEGKTHRIGGAVAMVGAFEYLRLTGQTLEGVNPLLQLAVMYPAASFGSVFPDVDHHEGANPIKTPAGELFHKLVHIPDKVARKMLRGKKPKATTLKAVEKLVVVKHRAWQTHSILFTGLISYLIWQYTGSLVIENPNSLDAVLMHLLMTGFFVGLISHLVLDMLTTSGVYLFMFKKIRLVPRSEKFSTGSEWETKWVTGFLSLCFTYLAFSIIFSIVGIELIPLTYEMFDYAVEEVQGLTTTPQQIQ